MKVLRFLLLLSLAVTWASASVREYQARDTIQPLELDHGETLRFQRRDGQVRSLRLDATGAEILLSNIRPGEFRRDKIDHGMLYWMWADVTIDGHPLRLSRYLSSQATFAHPFVVNGMRIWLDAVTAPFEEGWLGGGRGGVPRKHARLAVNDLTDAIAPQPIAPWYRTDANTEGKQYIEGTIDIRGTYKGDDPHMGAYQGGTAHRGLDINMPRGTPMLAPIDFDDHAIFSGGHRWRGVRNWPDGSIWWLQSHHLVENSLKVPPHTPVAQGTDYADGAGTGVGEAAHSHFEFTILEGDTPYWMDPWILFWQTHEQRRDQDARIRAAIAPLSPARTGVPVPFDSSGSRAGNGAPLRYAWTFGDGGFSADAQPMHTYLRPGVYAVHLTVDDGEHRHDALQVITVDGEPSPLPGTALSAPDAVEFHRRPASANRIYGVEPPFLPHTLRFTARTSRPRTQSGRVHLLNRGGGNLPMPEVAVDRAGDPPEWCVVTTETVDRKQRLDVAVNATGLAAGVHHATVRVSLPGTVDGGQSFRVELHVRDDPPKDGIVVVNNTDAGFFATPWFWVDHGFHVNRTSNRWGLAGRWDQPMAEPALLDAEGRNRMGVGETYLTAGYRAEPGQFVRFTPDLSAGHYVVSTPPATPWDRTTEVDVRVRHADGETRLRYDPGRDPVIGTFRFEEGTDGWVEFHVENSVGQVSADAVLWTPTEGAEKLLVDNSDWRGIYTQWAERWIAATDGDAFHGPNYFRDSGHGWEKKTGRFFRFMPRMTDPGHYELFMRWPAGRRHAPKVPVVVRTASGDETFFVNQREAGGTWNSLGIFLFDPDTVRVEIRVEETEGIVVADAVRFEKRRQTDFSIDRQHAHDGPAGESSHP